MKLSCGSGFLITFTTAPCFPSSFVPAIDFSIQWSSFHTACGLSRVGWLAWIKRIVGKQRRTRKIGNTDGKTIILLSKYRRAKYLCNIKCCRDIFQLRVRKEFLLSVLKSFTFNWWKWNLNDLSQLKMFQKYLKL